MKSGKRIAAIILIILAITAVIVAAAILVISALSNKRSNEDTETSAVTAIEDVTTSAAVREDVLNIVYLGIDKVEDRSDVMMVISINKTLNTINVVSLLRDSKVMIEGCSVGTKLGYAYKWGGESLALKAINENYGTNLRKYISMQFEDVEDLVNAVGGVEIDVTKEEVPHINKNARGMGYEGDDISAGVNILNGVQAVAYSRIRSTDGGEYIRASRQQAVIKEIFRKVRAMSRSEQLSFVDTLMDNMKSNMFMDEFSKLTEMDMSSLQLNEYTIPDITYDGDLWSGWEKTPETKAGDPPLDEKQWLWIYDLDKAGERLKGYIGE